MPDMDLWPAIASSHTHLAITGWESSADWVWPTISSHTSSFWSYNTTTKRSCSHLIRFSVEVLVISLQGWLAECKMQNKCSVTTLLICILHLPTDLYRLITIIPFSNYSTSCSIPPKTFPLAVIAPTIWDTKRNILHIRSISKPAQTCPILNE